MLFSPSAAQENTKNCVFDFLLIKSRPQEVESRSEGFRDGP